MSDGPKTTLTRRQKELLDYLDDHIREHGFAPTLEETGRHFGLSSLATVHKHLTNLERKGLIRRSSGRSRALEVVPPVTTPAETLDLPLLGMAAAGAPLEAVLDNETITVPQNLVRKRRNSFALRVSGSSMHDAGILDGDIVIVESRPSAESGETVVAVLDGAATIKKMHRENGGRIRLQPANDSFDPIFCREEELEIRGVVVSLMRSY
jgi:repressor LexA